MWPFVAPSPRPVADNPVYQALARLFTSTWLILLQSRLELRDGLQSSLGAERGMSTKDSTEGSRKRPTWVTAIVLLNFALLASLLLPWSHNWNIALKREGLDSSVVLAFQLCVLGSTLLATVFFVWR